MVPGETLHRAGLWTGLTTVLVLAGAPAAAQTEADEALYARMNRDIVERHVLPGYGALARATADLAAAAESCDRQEIDPAYHAAMDAWMAVQHVAVGPVELMMRQPRLHFWPDSRNTGSRQLSQLLADRPEVTEETLAEGGPIARPVAGGDAETVYWDNHLALLGA